MYDPRGNEPSAIFKLGLALYLALNAAAILCLIAGMPEIFGMLYWFQLAVALMTILGLWRVSVRRRRNEAVDDAWDVSVPWLSVIFGLWMIASFAPALAVK
jgi:hypothetical protein